MNKNFLIILLILFTSLFQNCQKGITDESNLITTSTFDSTYLKIGVPTQGLIAYFPFNGTADDWSGNWNNGTNHGATLTSDRFGNSRRAYHFTGGNYISIPELFSDTVSAFTFTVWVMKDSVDNNNHAILYKGLDQGEASLSITSLKVGFGVNLETGVLGAQNWFAVNVSDTLRAKTYYFLVGRYIKGGKVDLLINGQLNGSLTVPNLPLAKWTGHSYSAIGTHTSFPATYGWNGVIDDVLIYNRALSDIEIQSLYHDGGWTGN